MLVEILDGVGKDFLLSQFVVVLQLLIDEEHVLEV